MSKKRRHNIPLLLAVILLILTLVSMRLTGGLFARYRSMSASSDEARVAKFEVSATVAEVAEKNGEFTVTVTNKSEVAVSYEIVVKFTEAVDPAKLDVTIEGATREISDDKMSIKFTDTNWKFAPNAETSATHKLVFALKDWTFVTGGAEGTKEASKNLSFTVDITATQID